MEKKIYNYIKGNEVVSINDIVYNLNLPGNLVLKTVLELRAESFVVMYPPVPLHISNNESCYYAATSKKYPATTSSHQSQ